MGHRNYGGFASHPNTQHLHRLRLFYQICPIIYVNTGIIQPEAVDFGVCLAFLVAQKLQNLLLFVKEPLRW